MMFTNFHSLQRLSPPPRRQKEAARLEPAAVRWQKEPGWQRSRSRRPPSSVLAATLPTPSSATSTTTLSPSRATSARPAAGTGPVGERSEACLLVVAAAATSGVTANPPPPLPPSHCQPRRLSPVLWPPCLPPLVGFSGRLSLNSSRRGITFLSMALLEYIIRLRHKLMRPKTWDWSSGGFSKSSSSPS